MATDRYEKMSDEMRNRTIEQAFFERAVGGRRVREEKIVTEGDGQNTGKEKKEVVVKKSQPDLNAILSWLKRRAPERWADGATDGEEKGIRIVSCVPRPSAPPEDEKEDVD